MEATTVAPKGADAEQAKRDQWQAQKLMNRLVEVVKQYPPPVVLPILGQLMYDFARFHGANVDGIGEIMAAVHASRMKSDAEERAAVNS